MNFLEPKTLYERIFSMAGQEPHRNKTFYIARNPPYILLIFAGKHPNNPIHF